jgi:general secretion pathway protein N
MTPTPRSATRPALSAWGTTGHTALALAFGLGAGAAVLGFAPAHWLASPIAQATGGKVQLVNARGTVWQGRADVLLTGGSDSQDRAALPGGLRWQLSLAWPGLTLALNAPCCTPQGLKLGLQPGWGGWGVATPAHQSQWPAALLAGLGTPWNTLQLQGQLALQTPGLSLKMGPGGLRSEGQATLDVLNAASRLSTVRPMGSYRLQWQAGGGDGQAGGDGRLTLSTQSGALQLQGEGQWVAGRLRFEGAAEASPGREDALANLLNILGRRQGARTLIKIG